MFNWQQVVNLMNRLATRWRTRLHSCAVCRVPLPDRSEEVCSARCAEEWADRRIW